MYIFVFVGLSRWTDAWVFLPRNGPLPGVFFPEVDQCLGFLPRSGPMPGVFSAEVDHCLGFSVKKCTSAWGFLLRIDPKPGLFSPGLDRCLFFVLVFYRSETIPGFVYP